MSRQEVDRLGVVQAVVERRLRQGDGARQLGLSVRQVKRLCRRYRAEGAAGLVSRKRAKRANNANAAIAECKPAAAFTRPLYAALSSGTPTPSPQKVEGKARQHRAALWVRRSTVLEQWTWHG